MELPNQDKIRTLEEKETYKYLGILEADTIKQVDMKEKIKKEYLRRTRWFGFVVWILWHINLCRSFNAKLCLYIYIQPKISKWIFR